MMKFPILPLEDQFKLKDSWLLKRLNSLLPKLMEECQIDMWIIIGDEYNEGPCLKTLLPSSFFHSRRKSIIIFNRDNNQVERLIVSKPDFTIDKFYKPVHLKPKGMNHEVFYSTFATDYDLNMIRAMKEETTEECLNRIINERNPKSIALNFSTLTPFSDEISKSNYQFILNSIDQKFHSRIKSAEDITLRWLETRIDEELNMFKKIVEITREIIKECYSNNVIKPNKTTIGEARFFLMERAISLGMQPWFNATMWIRRKGSPHISDDSEIIKKGDLLHCDFGVEFLNLCSDIQEMAYVKDENDEELILELQDIHKKTMKLQDILASNFKQSRTGNEILKDSLISAKQYGIRRPMIYTHPIGTYGHGPGPTIGLFSNQNFVEGMGEYPLHDYTCYAMELNIVEPIKQWDDLNIMYGQEIQISFIDNKVSFSGGRQTNIHIIE